MCASLMHHQRRWPTPEGRLWIVVEGLHADRAICGQVRVRIGQPPAPALAYTFIPGLAFRLHDSLVRHAVNHEL